MSKQVAKSAGTGRLWGLPGLTGLLGLVVLGLLLGVGESGSGPEVRPALSRPPLLQVSAAALRPLDRGAWLGMGPLGVRRMEGMLDRIDHPSERCLKAGTRDRRSRGKQELTRLFEILSASAAARDLIEIAWRRNVFVCIDRDTDLLAYYVAGLRLIGVSPRLTEGQRVVFLAHELSHIPQHPTYSDDRRFPAGDLVLLRRAREAAAEALATRIAWELREAGYSAAWEDKRRDDFYGDIVRAFSDGGASGGDMLSAMRAAYDQWFAKQARRDLYDRMTVDHLARAASDDRGLMPPSRRLGHGFLLGLGRVPDGNYLGGGRGRALIDAHYAAHLAPSSEARIERLLGQATPAAPAAPPVSGNARETAPALIAERPRLEARPDEDRSSPQP